MPATRKLCQLSKRPLTALPSFFRRPGMTASAVVLVPLALAVLAFPFFIGSVDISSVGPPPTQ